MAGTAQDASISRGDESEDYGESDVEAKSRGKIDVSLSESSEGEYESEKRTTSPTASPECKSKKKSPKRRAKKSTKKVLKKQSSKSANNIFFDKMKPVCNKCARAIRDDRGFLTKKSYFEAGGRYADDAFDSYMAAVRAPVKKHQKSKKKDIDQLSDDGEKSWDSLGEYVDSRGKEDKEVKASGTPPPAGKGHTTQYAGQGEYGAQFEQEPYELSPSQHHYVQYYAKKGKKGKGKQSGKLSKGVVAVSKGKPRKASYEEGYYWPEEYYGW